MAIVDDVPPCSGYWEKEEETTGYREFFLGNAGHPNFTRPAEWGGAVEVPEELLSERCGD